MKKGLLELLSTLKTLRQKSLSNCPKVTKMIWLLGPVCLSSHCRSPPGLIHQQRRLVSALNPFYLCNSEAWRLNKDLWEVLWWGRWMALLEKTFLFKAGVRDPSENLMKVADSPPQKMHMGTYTKFCKHLRGVHRPLKLRAGQYLSHLSTLHSSQLRATLDGPLGREPQTQGK